MTIQKTDVNSFISSIDQNLVAFVSLLTIIDLASYTYAQNLTPHL